MIEAGTSCPKAAMLLVLACSVLSRSLLYLQGCDVLGKEGEQITSRHIVGLALWAVGWGINLHSDHILRNLRKPGDSGTPLQVPLRGHEQQGTDKSLAVRHLCVEARMQQSVCLYTHQETMHGPS